MIRRYLRNMFLSPTYEGILFYLRNKSYVLLVYVRLRVCTFVERKSRSAGAVVTGSDRAASGLCCETSPNRLATVAQSAILSSVWASSDHTLGPNLLRGNPYITDEALHRQTAASACHVQFPPRTFALLFEAR